MMFVLLFVNALLVLSSTSGERDRVAEGRLYFATFEKLTERTMLAVHDLRDIIAAENGNPKGLLTSSRIPELVGIFLDAKMEAEQLFDDAILNADTDPHGFVETEVAELAHLGDNWADLVIEVLDNLPTASPTLIGIGKIFGMLQDQWFDLGFAVSVYRAETKFISLKTKHGVSRFSHANVNFFSTVISQFMFNKLPGISSMLMSLAPHVFKGTATERAILKAHEQVILSAVDQLTSLAPFLVNSESRGPVAGAKTHFETNLPQIAARLTATKQELDKLIQALPLSQEDPRTPNLSALRRTISVRAQELGSLIKHSRAEISRF